MSNVINIFTKKPLELDDFRRPPKNDALDTLLGRSESVFDAVRARFGESGVPDHFEHCMTVPQPRPYMHGDTTSVIYRIKKGQDKFNRPMPVPSLIDTVSVYKNKRGVIELGSKCVYGVDEPFPWIDNKYHITLNFLKSLPNGTEILITTRSDLIATDDYITELRRLKPQITILYSSKNEAINRRLEPGAPSFQRRETAVNLLNDWGCNATLGLHELPAKYRHYLTQSA